MACKSWSSGKSRRLAQGKPFCAKLAELHILPKFSSCCQAMPESDVQLVASKELAFVVNMLGAQ